MAPWYPSSIRPMPGPPTTGGETFYGPDGAPPDIVIWPSVSRSRERTASVKGFALNTARTNLDIQAQCRFHFGKKMQTANSLRRDLVEDFWDRGVREFASSIYQETGVTILVCKDQVAFDEAISRIPVYTLELVVGLQKVHPDTGPFDHLTTATLLSPSQDPTSGAPGTQASKPDKNTIQTFPTDTAVPDMVVSAYFARHGTAERKQAQTGILHAACKSGLLKSRILETLSASVEKLRRSFTKERLSEAQRGEEMTLFRKKVGDVVAEVSRDSAVPITVCYSESDYARTMEQNPDLVVVKGDQRDTLVFHNLKEGFLGRDGRDSDPGSYSDNDVKAEVTNVNDGGVSSKNGRRMSG